MVQSCIKLEVGEEGCRYLTPPFTPFPLYVTSPQQWHFPRGGDKTQSLQVAKGNKNSCSRDWFVTMAVGTWVTNTWTSTAHGRHQHWRHVSRFQVTKMDKHRADVETHILLLLSCSTADGPYNTTSMNVRKTEICPDFSVSRKFSAFFWDLTS